MASDRHEARGLLDALTDVDNLLREQIEQNERMRQQMEQQGRALQQIADQAGSGGSTDAAEEEHVQPNAYPFDFSKDVPKDTPRESPVTEEREIEWPARVQRLLISWPPGAERTTGVQFRTRSGEKLAPRDNQSQYLFGDDLAHPFMVRENVSADDDLVAQFINTDTQNNHEIVVVAEIERRG